MDSNKKEGRYQRIYQQIEGLIKNKEHMTANMATIIACDSRSKSEIVVPLKDPVGKVIGVLDVDSKELSSSAA